MTKKDLIESFLASLGEVDKNNSIDGFTIICLKCKSTNITNYNDIRYGSEYTGSWGGAGFKCKDCGNAKEVYEA